MVRIVMIHQPGSDLKISSLEDHPELIYCMYIFEFLIGQLLFRKKTFLKEESEPSVIHLGISQLVSVAQPVRAQHS